MAEQRTFNPRVAGSSPARPTEDSSEESSEESEEEPPKRKSHPDPLLKYYELPPNSTYNRPRYFVIVSDSDAGETVPVAGHPELREVEVIQQTQEALLLRGPIDAVVGRGEVDVRTEKAVADFLHNRQALNRKPTTIEWYQGLLKRFADSYSKLPTDPALIEEFLGKIQGEPETRHAYYRCLKALYRFICKRHKIRNPMESIDSPTVPTKIMPTLEPREMMKLLNLASSLRDKAMLSLFIDSGARSGEMRSLRRQGIKQYTVMVKGKTGEREIPISDETRRLLLSLAASHPESDYVFTNYKGEPLTRSGIYHIIRDYMRKAGIESPKMGPHRLRHAFGKGYLVRGGDVRSLQRIMGHRNISTTEKYTDLNMEDLVAKHRRFTPLRSTHDAAQEKLFTEQQLIEEVEEILERNSK